MGGYVRILKDGERLHLCRSVSIGGIVVVLHALTIVLIVPSEVRSFVIITANVYVANHGDHAV